ncbi:MAG: glycoside hydrolase family 2 TIM barrel-domain containing protein [Flavobacteriaceae bacterium]
MKNSFLIVLLSIFSFSSYSQLGKVSVKSDNDQVKLVVNGEDFMINGMNWDYIPRGTNYSFNLWNQSDDFIISALDAEMGLLRNMGVNTIRTYTGIQPRWVQYIYENYGIHTILNHSFGRYGLTLDGTWVPVTDYSSPAVKELLMSEITALAEEFKNTPGLLMILLGNENNYGLFWAGAETEDFPDEEDQRRAVGENRGRPMYKLMNEAAIAIKEIDGSRPVAICNGDLLFLDIIAQECQDVDIYGTNMYRGISFGDTFERVKNEYGKPVMFTEFGSDAFNALSNKEDQQAQATIMVGQWKEIYANAAGLGKTGNSIGGCTFQFSDGWWKFGQTDNLDIHDNNASWSNGGYPFDYKPGQNNMNEEWFGICAKGPNDARGLYDLYPRAAYYALKEVHTVNPYADGIDAAFLNNHFDNIQIMDAMLRARGDKAAMGGDEKLRISNLRAEFTSFNTGGDLTTTPETANSEETAYPDQLGFDHMQSYFVGVEGKPAPGMRAEVNVNVLGNVTDNAIDEIFYENRGRPQKVVSKSGDIITINDPNRVQVYNAEFEWNAKNFDLRGFYRTGHYHWAYEGDVFNLYPESYYGPNLDIYNGEILGAELDAKGALSGLKAAFGPQLWWGANPAVLLKYSKDLLKWKVTGVYHRDLVTNLEYDESGRRVLNENQLTSGVIPAWPTERATLAFERKIGNFGFTFGGIWGGSPLNGSSFQVHDKELNQVFVDKIIADDNWGAKAKITYQKGRLNWYAQGSYMGLVANGGADQTRTFTGWKLKDSGSGNMTNVLSGFTYLIGNLQIAPNFLYQKPLIDPIPNAFTGPGRLRNVIDDPFAVRGGNREMSSGEILFTFDPTPGTWMYEWNNDVVEDAKFAMSAGFVYKHLPTTQDAHIGFLANRQFFAFGQSAPAEDLWEAHTRVVSKLSPELGMIGNFYYGNGQANGDSDRTIKRFGGDVRMIYKNMKMISHVKVNDWGPYDYHRDFNLTFPLQLMVDFSTSLGKQDWFGLPNTQIGIRGTWRSLDQYSPRYSPAATTAGITNPAAIDLSGYPEGTEWEIRTYVHINIGK